MNNAIPQRVRQLDQRVLDHTLPQISHYYRQTLLSSFCALEFLKRQLNCEQPNFALLGYSNRTLGTCLPSARSKEGQMLRGSLKRLGILRASGHEHLCGSAIVMLHKGTRVLGMYGQRIGRCQSNACSNQWLVFDNDIDRRTLPCDLNAAYQLALSLAKMDCEVHHAT